HPRTRSSRWARGGDRDARRAQRNRRGRSPARKRLPANPHAPGARCGLRRGEIRSSCGSCFGLLQHAPANLVRLDAFEQGPEIALAEAFIALALDEFEE